MSSEYSVPSFSLPEEPGTLRVIAIGSLDIVNQYIMTQHRLGYAMVTEWSRPLPAPTAGEMMRVLTKRYGS